MRREIVLLALLVAAGCGGGGGSSSGGTASPNPAAKQTQCQTDCMARTGGDFATCQRTCQQGLPFIPTPTPSPLAS